MKVKEYKATGIQQNNVVRNPSFSEMTSHGLIQPVYKWPHHFTVVSSVDKSFIVDWQLGEE